MKNEKILSVALVAIMSMPLVASDVFAENGISYIGVDGTAEEYTGTYNTVTENDIVWTDGWYIVSGDVTIGSAESVQTVTVTGDVKLVLSNDSSLTVNGSIVADDDDDNALNGSVNSLTVYAQSEDDSKGNLVVQNAAMGNNGIGGSGTINIYGGKVVAEGGKGKPETKTPGGVGISGDITIGGGVVIAKGGAGETNDRSQVSEESTGGAGISGNVIINGGVVTAVGGNGGDGQKCDYSEGCDGGNGAVGMAGSIRINGGMVDATGGNGGNGGDGTEDSEASDGGNGGAGIGANLIVNNGIVAAKGGNGGNRGTTVDISSTYYGNYGMGAAGIGVDNGRADTVITINGGNITAIGGEESVGLGADGNSGNMTVNVTGGELEATGGAGKKGIDASSSNVGGVSTYKPTPGGNGGAGAAGIGFNSSSGICKFNMDGGIVTAIGGNGGNGGKGIKGGMVINGGSSSSLGKDGKGGSGGAGCSLAVNINSGEFISVGGKGGTGSTNGSDGKAFVVVPIADSSVEWEVSAGESADNLEPVESVNNETYTSNKAVKLYGYKTAIKGAKIDSGKTVALLHFSKKGTYTVIFASYNEGRMEKVDPVTVTVTGMGATTVSSEEDIALTGGDKIMLWNNLTDLTPLCEEYVIAD